MKGTKMKEKDRFDLTLDRIGVSINSKWDELLDRIEADENKNLNLKWLSKNVLRRLSIEAPIIIGFTLICIILHLLNMTVLPGVSRYLGVRDRLELTSPMQYVRMLTHIFGHENIAHLRRNMTNVLLVGPSAEGFFGSKFIFETMVAVAVSFKEQCV